ncbi:MAG: ABC transporter ATP-binding protein [Oscillospiraceae bacterium]|nr:ABC transporter ATP-binding protein [Oscillospiraceae bacterium]
MNGPLTVEGLGKVYPGFSLGPLGFALEPGKITGFIGRNGAGKTTTLHAVVGFLRPDSGTVRFWGQALEGHEALLRQRVGFVSAGMRFYQRQSLKRITDTLRPFYTRWDEGAYRRCLRRFALDEGKTPEKLSNGMQLKYLLSLALSHGAELLLLDEPTSGLDPVSRAEVLETLLTLRDAGCTVLFSTHITSDLEKTADRILYLSRGELKADCTLDDFTDAWRLYHGTADAVAALPPELVHGRRRSREGLSALLRRADADALGLPCESAGLEDVMVHLEQEADEHEA